LIDCGGQDQYTVNCAACAVNFGISGCESSSRCKWTGFACEELSTNFDCGSHTATDCASYGDCEWSTLTQTCELRVLSLNAPNISVDLARNNVS
jgi:hypothetical protein